MVTLMYETCKNGHYEMGIKEFTEEEIAQLLYKENERMSVPAYERRLSPVEYVKKANELYDFTVNVCTRISKKYTFFGRQQLYDYADKIADHCVAANSYNVVTNYTERTMHLDQALAILNCMANKCGRLLGAVKFEKKQKNENGEVVKDEYGHEVLTEDKKRKERYIVKWGTLISECIKLIRGVKSSDKQRIGK